MKYFLRMKIFPDLSVIYHFLKIIKKIIQNVQPPYANNKRFWWLWQCVMRKRKWNNIIIIIIASLIEWSLIRKTFHYILHLQYICVRIICRAILLQLMSCKTYPGPTQYFYTILRTTRMCYLVDINIHERIMQIISFNYIPKVLFPNITRVQCFLTTSFPE